MKSAIKKAGIGVCAALTAVCASAALAVAFVPQNTSVASAEALNSYYYRELTDKSKLFYDAIDAMAKDGSLKTGEGSYDLVANNVVTEAELATFATSSDIMSAYGAARDAYKLDHPEVFYVDFDYMSINVATKGGAYTATLGTGRGENYYIENGFSSQTEVEAAITQFNTKLDAFVNATTGSTVAEKVTSVNKQLIDSVVYTYAATADANGTTYDADNAATYIHNTYGAIVNGKAVCEGYAKGFKVIMDKLGIPCVLVQGYSQSSPDEEFQPHMWDYVQIDGVWYAVDVTWNDGENLPEDGYLLRGSETMEADHITEGVVSEVNFEFVYPVLSLYDYDSYGSSRTISVNGIYNNSNADGTGSTLLTLEVSYDGKNADELAKEGSYLIYRTFSVSAAEGAVYTNWSALYGDMSPADQLAGKTVLSNLGSSFQYVQFALTTEGNEDGIYLAVDEDQIELISQPFNNNAYGTYVPAPYIASQIPEKGTTLDIEKTYDMSVTYDEKMKISDSSKPIEVIVTSQHSDIMDYVTVSNVKLSDDGYTVSFTFKPSELYQHRDETYCMLVNNIVGESSNKAANGVYYLVKRTTVVCNKVFDDERLYIKAYGEPTLVGTSDLSVNGWKNEDDEYVCQNQRSQLMLVINKPDDAQSESMVDGALSSSGIDSSSVASAETYELEINICKQIKEIPKGSFVQLSFGFPAGYGPDSAGVTFSVYHFNKKDDGTLDYDNPDKLDCVITEYGLVVTVTSFSPFVILTVNGDSTDTSKTVWARAVGNGGSIEGNAIAKAEQGGSVTYTFTPDSGYQVERLLLNDQEIEVSGNTATLTYDQLKGNDILYVYFASSKVVQAEKDAGLTPVYGNIKVEAKKGTAVDDSTLFPDNSTEQTPSNPDNEAGAQQPGSGNTTNNAADKSNDMGTLYIVLIIIIPIVFAIVLIAMIVLAHKKSLKNK